ncbi:hypothetical protein V1477_008471, partial [Vespula maculifrons]
IYIYIYRCVCIYISDCAATRTIFIQRRFDVGITSKKIKIEEGRTTIHFYLQFIQEKVTYFGHT